MVEKQGKTEYREFKRDEVPLQKKIFPLSFEGEGDTGGEVNIDYYKYKSDSLLGC